MQYQQVSGFAIVGCGLIGRRRAALLPPGTLRCACDLGLGRAQQLVQRVGSGSATTDFDALLRDEEVQVILVSAANASLAPMTLQAVQAGKHVLVEKPGAVNARQLEEIGVAAKKSGSLVRVGYNHRFHPAFLKTREIMEQADVGELMFIRGRYGHGGRVGYDREWRADPRRSGGGELIDQGVHLIDLAGIFLGDFVEVEGHASTLFWDMPVDDNAFLSLRNAAGKTAWLQVSCTEWKNLFSFEIYTRSAKFEISGLGGSYGVEKLFYYRMLPEMGPPETTIYEYPRGDSSWRLELEAFLEDIRLSRVPVPGIAEAKKILEIVEQIYRSSGYQLPSAELATRGPQPGTRNAKPAAPTCPTKPRRSRKPEQSGGEGGTRRAGLPSRNPPLS
jgi:predicted dehydrogenase